MIVVAYHHTDCLKHIRYLERLDIMVRRSVLKHDNPVRIPSIHRAVTTFQTRHPLHTSNSRRTRLLWINRNLSRVSTLAVRRLSRNIVANICRSRSAVLIGAYGSSHTRRARLIRHAKSIALRRSVPHGHTVPLIGCAGARNGYIIQSAREYRSQSRSQYLPLITVDDPPASVPS